MFNLSLQIMNISERTSIMVRSIKSIVVDGESIDYFLGCMKREKL